MVFNMTYNGGQMFSKTCLEQPLKNGQNKDLNDKWQLPLEHSAILLTCIKRYLVLKTNFLSFESGRFKQVFLQLGFLHWNESNSKLQANFIDVL